MTDRTLVIAVAVFGFAVSFVLGVRLHQPDGVAGERATAATRPADRAVRAPSLTLAATPDLPTPSRLAASPPRPAVVVTRPPKRRPAVTVPAVTVAETPRVAPPPPVQTVTTPPAPVPRPPAPAPAPPVTFDSPPATFDSQG